MSTRRQLFQIAAAGAAIAQAEQHEDHEAAGAKPAKKTARYFTKKADLELLAKLVDHIIPRSDTPGAADANVHYYIDWLAHTNATFGAKIQGDIAWIRSQKFMSKTHGEQVQLLTKWSHSESEPRQIFQRLKDMTIDGYYGTQEGLKTELGWNANTFVREYKGCTHPEHG